MMYPPHLGFYVRPSCQCGVCGDDICVIGYDESTVIHKRGNVLIKEMNIFSRKLESSYVSVNSNWIHPPRATPGKIFFQRANPGHPGKIFCLIPCPSAKNDGRIPGGGAKFSQTRRNCSLSLQKKSLKN